VEGRKGKKKKKKGPTPFKGEREKRELAALETGPGKQGSRSNRSKKGKKKKARCSSVIEEGEKGKKTPPPSEGPLEKKPSASVRNEGRKRGFKLAWEGKGADGGDTRREKRSTRMESPKGRKEKEGTVTTCEHVRLYENS